MQDIQSDIGLYIQDLHYFHSKQIIQFGTEINRISVLEHLKIVKIL